MHSFEQAQAAYTALTDNALRAYIQAPGLPPLLRESMSYSLFAGGKRLRPCMALASCEMLGGNPENALPFACALEMIHTYSLIHDDLPAMDDDKLRRGKPTNHIVYGEGQAILAGDGLLSYAFEILLDTLTRDGRPNAVRAAACVARGAGVFGMVKGQCLDLQQEEGGSLEESTLLAIHSGKTAAMIIAAVEAGALCANADERELNAVRSFGQAYGLLFQITDDILDIEGDTENLGKSTGKDARAGKLTFPALYGLRGAKEKARSASEDAYGALRLFGERAAYFHELTAYTLTRKK